MVLVCLFVTIQTPMKKHAKDLFRQLFPSYVIKNDSEQMSQNQPLIRDAEYKKEFDSWKNSPAQKLMREQLSESYLNRSKKESSIRIALYTAPGAIGLTLKLPDQTDIKYYRFVLDCLREQVLTLQYSLYSSSVEEKSGANEMKQFFERHYLKPNIVNTSYPVNQLYGNIMLELEFEPDQVKYLKVMSTYHTGYNYIPPLGFDDLVRYLFSCKSSGSDE
jgi:hypothetical protein